MRVPDRSEDRLHADSRDVAAGGKLTQGRQLKTDPPRHGLLRWGGAHVGDGGSGGDPGLETAGQEHAVNAGLKLQP